MNEDQKDFDLPTKGEAGEQTRQEGPLIRLQEWLRVIGHTHSRLTFHHQQDLRESLELQNWQDGQLPHKTLREILAKLGEKKGGFYVVDTEHAAHALDVYHPKRFPEKKPEEVRELRWQAFQRDNLAETIAVISERVKQRAEIVKKEGGERVFTGVEADILDSEGTLDVSQETLRSLDCVGVSLHREEWFDVNGRNPSLDEILSAYEKLSLNSVVDVINHPIRQLTQDEWQNVLSEENKSRWRKIFNNLATQGVCLEINLKDLIDEEKREQNEIYLELIRIAKDCGVKFILGTDFHRIEQYGKELPESDLARLQQISSGDNFFTDIETQKQYVEEIEEALREIFSQGEGMLPARNILALVRPIYRIIRRLTEIGLTPEDIVNGDLERFKNWINLRRQKKQEGNS